MKKLKSTLPRAGEIADGREGTGAGVRLSLGICLSGNLCKEPARAALQGWHLCHHVPFGSLHHRLGDARGHGLCACVLTTSLHAPDAREAPRCAAGAQAGEFKDFSHFRSLHFDGRFKAPLGAGRGAEQLQLWRTL
jgi:hypothetical protein